MLKAWLQNAVSLSVQRPLAIGAAAIALVVLSLVYAATHFDMTTDTGELISREADWRQTEEQVSAAFPRTNDSIAVVIDGRTPELAELSAAKLAAALAGDRANFVRVRRPGSGEFYERSGLLFQQHTRFAVWRVFF